MEDCARVGMPDMGLGAKHWYLSPFRPVQPWAVPEHLRSATDQGLCTLETGHAVQRPKL